MAVKPLVTEKTRTADAVLRVLEEAGIDMVFGIAGGHTTRLFAALARYQNTIRTMTVREESLAGVMAEVYGRLTGRPGVIIGQGAWVLGNGIIGILEAKLSSSPMLILTEMSDKPPFELHGTYQGGTGHYGAWNAVQAFRGVTKEIFEASDGASAVQATQLAIKHATTGQCGPVAVLFKAETLARSVDPQTRPRLYSTGPYLPPAPPPADPARVAAAAEVIAAARSPIIIAGNGVRISRAYDALTRFAEAAGIPVVTSASGKGVFTETHELALGVYGPYGLDAANQALGAADVVVVVGSKLSATDTGMAHAGLIDPLRQNFIQIDVEPCNASWTVPTEHALIGDAGVVLGQLADALPVDRGRHDRGVARVAELRATHGFFDAASYTSDAVPIYPQRVIGEMRAHLPASAIVTCDAGENRILMTHFYQTGGTDNFLQAAGAGPMGFAIPAAMGAKLVHPDRVCVAVCGDGGFAMTMNGLMSCVEHQIPIIVVVFNNSALGWVLHGVGPFAQEFADFDHAAMARAMKCNGVRITDPADLAGAIAAAVDARVPTVIDVITSLDVTYLDVTAKLPDAATV